MNHLVAAELINLIFMWSSDPLDPTEFITLGNGKNQGRTQGVRGSSYCFQGRVNDNLKSHKLPRDILREMYKKGP